MAGPVTETPPTEEIPTPGATHEAAPHPHAGSSEIDFPGGSELSANDVIVLNGTTTRHADKRGLIDLRANVVSGVIADSAEDMGFMMDDGEGGSFPDYQGLSMSLGNGERYVVRSVSLQQERRTEVRRVGLPRFHGEDHELHTFGREEQPTRVNKTWRLRFTAHIPGTNIRNVDGSKVAIQRRETSLVPKFQDRAVMVLERYDAAGDLIDARTRSLSDLDDVMHLAGEHGITEADWQERRDPSGEKQVVPISLPGYASRKRLNRESGAPAISDVITAQLEGQGIYNWEGLFWRRRTPGGPDGDASYTTQEIISDTSQKGTEPQGSVWGRHFIIRTTQATDNGIIIHDKRMKDSEFFSYLETGDVDLTISEMRLIRDKPDGWSAELGPSDDPSRRDWARSPEMLEPISLGSAFELMSYHKVYNILFGGKKAAKPRIKARIEALEKDSHERAIAEELQRTSSELGMDRFMDMIKDMHATYTDEIYRLGLRHSAWDYYSPSMMIRDLMEKRMENRRAALEGAGADEADLWDPLSNEFESRQYRNELIDLYVGRRFGREFTTLGKAMPVPTGKVHPKSKQPEHKIRQEFEHNPDMFLEPSVIDSDRLKAYKKKNKIWGPIEKQSDLVFRLLTVKPKKGAEDEDFDVRDYRERNARKNPHIESGRLAREQRKLGRMLRRTIPPRAWYREVRFS